MQTCSPYATIALEPISYSIDHQSHKTFRAICRRTNSSNLIAKFQLISHPSGGHTKSHQFNYFLIPFERPHQVATLAQSDDEKLSVVHPLDDKFQFLTSLA